MLRNGVRDIPNTKGRDALQMEDLPEADEQRDRHHHASPVAASAVAHQDLRCSRPRTQEESAGGSIELVSNTAAPGISEGLGVSLAPAFGGDMKAAEDMLGREKVRWGSPVKVKYNSWGRGRRGTFLGRL